MDQRERIDDFPEALRIAMEGQAKTLWTCLPAIIQSFDPAKCTISAQPAIPVRVRKPDGTSEFQNLPVLLDVPVVFPRGGAFMLTFPLAVGTSVLIVFADRCIDGWWQLGGTSTNPPEFRMHDLSDGFAIPSPLSLPGAGSVAGGINTNNAQLRTIDGSCKIEMTAAGAINITAPGGLTINGNVIATGTGVFAGHSVGAHIHADPQGGSTATPTG